MNTLSVNNVAAPVVLTAGTLPERAVGAAAPATAVKEVKNLANTGADTARYTPPSRDAVEVAAKQIESFVKSTNRNLSFSVDDSMGAPVVKVMDPETQDVIRQIPAEESLQIAKSLEFLSGVLVRQKA